MTKGATKSWLTAVACLSAAAGITGYAWFGSRRQPVLEVFVFYEPGTSAVFVRTPNDKRILINGGSNSGIIRSLTGVLPFYSRHIDAIIATVADDKHVTGLIDALNRYSIGGIIVPAVTLENLGLADPTDAVYGAFLKTAHDKKIPIEKALSGQRLVLDRAMSGAISQAAPKNLSASTTYMDILFPAPTGDFQYSKTSAPELLFRLAYGSTSMVFMGGATAKIQKFAAASSAPAGGLPVNALIVSQNASPSSMSVRLMDVLKPDYLVYSRQIVNSIKLPKASASQGFSPKKKPIDPLAHITADHRFNVRETGVIKITSDGADIRISKRP